jgi:hypothetical protein
MRGPLFRQLIENKEYNLEADENLEDLEKMYTLLIESRGKNINTLTRFDESIALATLCQFPIPGKTPKFSREARLMRNSYRGISYSRNLEQKFIGNIRYSFKDALNENQIDFDELRNLFFD